MPALTRRGSLGDLRKSVEEAIYKPLEEMSVVHIVDDGVDQLEMAAVFRAGKIHTSTLPSKTSVYMADHADLQTDLHGRYQSSEEETSPGPEDYASGLDESMEVLSAAEEAEDEEDDDEADFDIPSDADDEGTAGTHDIIISAIAVAIPLIFAGPPRLVDITRMAPMQKRRAPPAVPPYSAKRFSVVQANASQVTTRHFSIPTRSTSVPVSGSRPLNHHPSPLGTNSPSTASLVAATHSHADGTDATAHHFLESEEIDEAAPRVLECKEMDAHPFDMGAWHTNDGEAPATALTTHDDSTDASSLSNTTASNDDFAASLDTDASSLIVPSETDHESSAPEFERPGPPRRGSTWTERGWRGLGKRMLAGVDLGTGRKRGKKCRD